MKQILYKALNKLKLLKYFNLQSKIIINDCQIKIPIMGSTGFDNLNISEYWMVDVLNTIPINPQQLFIDVGVNIGQTLIKLKSVNHKVEYLGFEPNAKCISYVEQLVKLNQWIDVDLIPVGIAEKNCLAVLDHYSDKDTDSSASIIPEYRENSKVYQKDFVAIFKIEMLETLWDNKKISAIKIDVEGAELGVIESLKSTIKEHRPFLLIEILPVYNKENQLRLDKQIQIEEIFKSLEYKIYRINKNKYNEFDGYNKIDHIGIHDRLDWCDYLFSPYELSDK